MISKDLLKKLTRNDVELLWDSKFIKVYDLKYAPGKHYYDATRRGIDDLVAVKTDEEFRSMLPDAVTCAVIVILPDGRPRLLLSYEYRYTTKNFLLSPPAGLIDPGDAAGEEPLISTAKREIAEETGIVFGKSKEDRIFVINPLLFSSPGMTDESNGFVCAIVHLDDLSVLSSDGAEGSECFDGYIAISTDEAREILKKGTDDSGNYFSLATWSMLLYFVSGMWMSE